ncbi:MAG: glycosyltransferase [Candidatus Dormibacteraeota bacterium]|nr:glycosyltransferase [Candidatus Dormibacteraeota bacterium]
MVNEIATVAVAWCPFQARTTALAAALGGKACHISGGWPGGRKAFLPLRYLSDAVRTWRVLNRSSPRVVIAITPPVFSPLVGWLWCTLYGRVFVVDCHTGTFHSWKWGWAHPISRALLGRARAALVHTEEDQALVKGWGAPVLLLPDELPELGEALLQTRSLSPRIVVAGSLRPDEPVAAVLAAAALLPEAEVRITGDINRLPASVRLGAPGNASFTGYLPYSEFLGELEAADVVGVFTTNPHIMNRAAFEAIGLGRPLVLSDSPGLRARFGEAGLFCANKPRAMAQTLRRALHEQASLAEKSRGLQVALRTQRESAVAELRLMLEGETGRGGPLIAAS